MTTSNVFLEEIAKQVSVKIGSGLSAETGTAEITEAYTEDMPTELSISIERKAGTILDTGLISRKLATKLMEDFQDSYASKNTLTLDALAKKIAGASNIGKKRKTSINNISYILGSALAPEEIRGNSNLVETIGGDKRRTTTLRNLLEGLMQKYIVREMTKPRAPLKFRTGRFANSAKVSTIRVIKNSSGKDTLSLFYTYMVRPYSVFDPKISSYRNLSSIGRNPQRIIGESLQHAARDIIAKRYSLVVQQEGS